MTLLSFCRRFSSRSPCLIADWYCAFLASGLVVSITPATCIMEQHHHLVNSCLKPTATHSLPFLRPWHERQYPARFRASEHHFLART